MIIKIIITATIAFISTNIDDIFVLMVLFSQVNNSMKKIHIIIGQFIGIGILTAIGIIGGLGISVVPGKYIGFLGLIPIFLGIKSYLDYRKDDDKKESDISDDDASLSEKKGILGAGGRYLNPSIIKVCGITVANGADNIGIYIPLFASMKFTGILTTVIVFAIFTALWCIVGFKLAEHPLVQRTIEKYEHVFVPIIFIGLGLFILIENGTLEFVLGLFK